MKLSVIFAGSIEKSGSDSQNSWHRELENKAPRPHRHEIEGHRHDELEIKMAPRQHHHSGRVVNPSIGSVRVGPGEGPTSHLPPEN